MKKLIALTLALLLLAGCAATGGHGRTQWVPTEERTTYYDIETDTTWSEREVYSYDRSGNMTKSVYYEDDKPVAKSTYAYNAQGHITRDVSWQYLWIIPYPIDRVNYTYDDQGLTKSFTRRNGFGIKTEEEIIDHDSETITPDGTRFETVTEEGESGRTVTVTEYQDDAPVSTNVMRYDSEDRILEDITYGSRGEVTSSYTYVYEENTVTCRSLEGYTYVDILRPDGQPDVSETYDPAGNLVSKTVYTYREISIR